jgi:hypothetical protein
MWAVAYVLLVSQKNQQKITVRFSKELLKISPETNEENHDKCQWCYKVLQSRIEPNFSGIQVRNVTEAGDQLYEADDW